MSFVKMPVFGCLGVVLAFSLFGDRVEKLTPPMISQYSIDQEIPCTRPMREGKFNISVEEKNDKLLVHCYGHGGSGCTTLFGSVRKAIDLFKEQVGNRAKEPVRVIGGGIIGMTAAIELALEGYEVVSITAKELYDIPSWKNAGYFALVSVKTDPEEQENLAQIGLTSFKEYKAIHEGKHPYIKSDCIQLLPVYCSEGTESGVEDLEAAGLIPPRESVTLDFGNGVIHSNFVKFMTYFMDTTRIMIQLRETVDRLGIRVEQKELHSFEEVPESIIFNCSGFGAKSLNDDDKMIAVRGHLLNLNESAGVDHLNYMIYTKIKDSGEYVYMFPKSLQVTNEEPMGRIVYGTLGGTFIPYADMLSKEALEQLDQVEFQKLYDRNRQFFWGDVK